MTATELINELTYRSYQYNRQRAPDITPQQWGRIFPDAEVLEQRFQQEQTSKE